MSIETVIHQDKIDTSLVPLTRQECDDLFRTYKILVAEEMRDINDLVDIAEKYSEGRALYKIAELEIGTFADIYLSIKKCHPRDCNSPKLPAIALEIFGNKSKGLTTYQATRETYELYQERPLQAAV